MSAAPLSGVSPAVPDGPGVRTKRATNALLSLGRTTAALLLLSCIVMPTLLQPAKAALLAVALLCVLACLLNGMIRFSRSDFVALTVALGYSVMGLAWAVFGVASGNPGAVAMLTVHGAYPPLLVVLGLLVQADDLRRIAHLLMLGAALVLATQVAFIFSVLGFDGGLFSGWFMEMLPEGVAVVDASDDYLIFTLPSVGSLLFLGPWLALLGVLSARYRRWAAVLFLASVVAVLLAARRAALPAFVVGIVLGLMLVRRWSAQDTRKTLLVALVLLASLLFVAFATGVVSFDLIAERFASILDFESNESNVERRLQFAALLDGFLQRPLFGFGLGAVAAYVRSDEQPWAYELSYMALLFQFGILGTIAYAAGIAALLRRLVGHVVHRSPDRFVRISFACMAAGLLSFLISNATNPYLAKFDYMWVIFLPLAMSLRVHERRASATTAIPSRAS